MKQKINLIRLADVKAYIGLLDREEISMSKFAEILNECANEALFIHNINQRSEQLMQSCSVCGTTKHPVMGAHCKASNCPHEH